MDIDRIIAELKTEKSQIEAAIMGLEPLVVGKRRGRRPGWMVAVAAAESAQEPARSSRPANRKRRPFSAATRKKMAEAQRKRWAAARKNEA